jgi:hypothetical protein
LSVNKTKNQHYISVAEMKANCFNSQASGRKSKIYVFEVESEHWLRPKSRLKIEEINCYKHLYTIGGDGNNKFYNLEDEFNKYEGKFNFSSSSMYDLAQKAVVANQSGNDLNREYLKGLSGDLINLLVLKYLNHLRNPYRISEVLSKKSEFLGFKCNMAVSSKYIEILKKYTNPSIDAICEKYSCSEKEYRDWLVVLCHLMLDTKGHRNRLEEYLVRKLSSSYSSIDLCLYLYDEKYCCLLNDKAISFFEFYADGCDSSVYDNSSCSVIYFNINKNLFARLNCYPSSKYKSGDQIDINLDAFKNNLDAFEGFNHRMIREADTFVYCAENEFYGKGKFVEVADD